MTQRQKFQVLEKFELFELRQYEPCVLAEVSMTDSYGSASSKAFRPLFSYISKGNQTSQSIAMTAPVIAATQDSIASDNWKISFVMPAGSTLKDLPLPSEARVILREIGEERCVALAFRGRATQSLCEKKEALLRSAAHEKRFTLAGETRICRFDPPFKPGLLMYNEIFIPLA